MSDNIINKIRISTTDYMIDAYTKEQTDTLLNAKANQSDVTSLQSDVTRLQNAIGNIYSILGNLHLYCYDITILASQGNYCITFVDTDYTINTANDFGAYLIAKGYNSSDDIYMQISGGPGTNWTSYTHLISVFGIYSELKGSNYELRIMYSNTTSGYTSTSLSIGDFYCRKRQIF